MKTEEIKIRVSETLKKDFQDICESETMNMSNKIVTFISHEVKTKKIKPLGNNIMTKQLIKFGVVNGNDRIYRKSELTKLILDEDGFNITHLELLNKKTLYGQFCHPVDGGIIHKYNATHSITNLRIDDDWLIGDIKILNQSILPILDNLVFRPRSFGSIDNRGIVRGLEIIGFDAILKTDDKFRGYDDEDLQ